MIGRTRDNGIIKGYTSGLADDLDMRMYYVKNIGSVKVGDSVYTSGLDTRFPKGIYVGKVTAISRSSDTADKYLTVEPAADFTKIEEVYVLRVKIDDLIEMESVPDPTPAVSVTPAPTQTTQIYSFATQKAIDDNAIYEWPTETPDPNVTPTPSPVPTPTRPVPEAAWLNN